MFEEGASLVETTAGRTVANLGTSAIAEAGEMSVLEGAAVGAESVGMAMGAEVLIPAVAVGYLAKQIYDFLWLYNIFLSNKL